MGNDLSVVKAARVSTMGERVQVGPGEKGSRGLINYLMRDRHGSPFEHNSMTFFIQAPIFVFREFHRHRVGWSYHAESARRSEEHTSELPSLMRVSSGYIRLNTNTPHTTNT